MPLPPPRLTVRVGITGHRQDKLNPATEADVAREIGRVLAVAVTSAESLRAQRPGVYADQSVAIRVVSALAEGADRIAARAALDAGHELACILPFMRQEYEHDFHTPASIQEFKSLLHHASSVLEIDGPRGNRDQAYDDVGRVVLRQCDVLIAVWDGKPPTGPGGTAHVVAQARELEIPVVWIDSNPPHACVIIDDAAHPGANTRAVATLSSDFEQILFPPLEHPTPLPPIYDVGPPGARFRPRIFRAFRTIIELGQHQHIAGPVAPASRSDVIEREYQRVDRLADDFGDTYRDSFVANYLLAAGAVIAALLALNPWVELVLIALIVFGTWAAKHYRMHERWLGCRLLAEQFRHLRFLHPIACSPAPLRPANDTETADPESQWGLWLLQARIREMPMLNAKFDSAYLAQVRDQLALAIHEQRHYHAAADKRNEHLHHRLHGIGSFLFATTLVLCIAHLAWPSLHESWLGEHFLLFAAGLPALGAAFAGINNHGEFGRVSQRSRAMERRLAELANQLESERELRSKTLARIAERAASMMSAELRDWQYLSWGRPITLPS